MLEIEMVKNLEAPYFILLKEWLFSAIIYLYIQNDDMDTLLGDDSRQ